MTEFNKEPLASCLKDLKVLGLAHYKEISAFTDTLVCEADWDTYDKLDAAGVLHIVTARLDGKLIGYCVDTVSPSLHYKHDLFAVNDVVYLLPEHRKATIGYRLLKTSRDLLKARGVSVHLLHMKADHSFATLAEGLGYSLHDLIYSNVLKGA